MTKIAVVYFSRADENYINGQMTIIQEGLTKQLVEKLAHHLRVDIYQVKRSQPYPKTYRECADVAKTDLDNLTSLAIDAPEIDWTNYDRLIVAYPIFWSRIPAPLQVFLSQSKHLEIAVFPLVTHEGGEFGDSLDDLKKCLPKSSIKQGLAVQGSHVLKADQDLLDWLDISQLLS